MHTVLDYQNISYHEHGNSDGNKKSVYLSVFTDFLTTNLLLLIISPAIGMHDICSL